MQSPATDAPTLVLDLDGTLVDSVPDLAASLNRTAASRGVAPFTAAELTPMIGDGAAVLLQRAWAARKLAMAESDLRDFLDDYGAHAAVLSRLFPDADATMRAMRADGWRLAVCTNKPVAPARALLEALGVSDLFAAIGGGDSFPARKPDPAHLLATLAAAGGEPGRAVIVGDHVNDVQAAIGAGVPCIFAAWGYGPPAMAAGAQAIARGFPEVPALAARLAGA